MCEETRQRSGPMQKSGIRPKTLSKRTSPFSAWPAVKPSHRVISPMSQTPHLTDNATERWQALDRQHYLHPFTDSKSLHAKGTRVIVPAEGVYLYDSDGQRILDGMAGLWCVNVGYGRRELAEAAYRQLLELPYYNSFFQT